MILYFSLARLAARRERLGIEARFDVGLDLESLGGGLVLVLLFHRVVFLCSFVCLRFRFRPLSVFSD